MSEEFNKHPSEFSGEGKNHAPEEYRRVEQSAPEEFPSENEVRTSSHKKKNNGQSFMKITSFFTMVAAVAVVGVGAIPSSSTAAIDEVWATDTAIYYQVTVDEADDDIMIIAYNDFTRREATLTVGENSGAFEGLKPDMNYRIEVTAGSGLNERTLAETRLKTEKPIPPPVTEFYGITHECTCSVDGYFHFTLELIDENGYWSEYEATLTDIDGTVSRIEFSDPFIEQSIKVDIDDVRLLGNTATLVVTCRSTKDNPDGAVYELYRAEVKI